MAAERAWPPRKPTGLQGRGERWWRRMVDVYEFSEVEYELVVEAARTVAAVDELDKLVRSEGVTVVGARGAVQAHPALVEARQQRTVLGRLLAQLDLPDEDALLSPTSARARKAAASRWDQHRRRMGNDGGTT